MSVYADQGTAAHWVLEQCLLSTYLWGVPSRAEAFTGQTITIPADKEGDHSPLGPSGAKRWMTCSASAELCAAYPEAKQPERYVVVDEYDMSAVQTCLDYVAMRKAWIEEHYGPVTVLAERKVSSKKFTGSDLTDGTSDITLKAASYVEHIDYKHGKGVPVPAEDPQNAWYLLGTCAEVATALPAPNAQGHVWSVPFHQGRKTIVQPRCDKLDPRIRWVDIPDVNDWMHHFILEGMKAIEATVTGRGIFNPSEDACRWCRVGAKAEDSGAAMCEAYVQHCLAQSGMIEEDTRVPDHKELAAAGFAAASFDTRFLSDGQLTGLLDVREMVSGMFNAVEALCLSMVQQGTAGPVLMEHYKQVRGDSRRRWLLAWEETEKALGKLKVTDPETGKERKLKKAEKYVQQPKGVKPVEELLKVRAADKPTMEAFYALVDKPPGKLMLVPRSHGKDEVPGRLSATEAFANVPELPPVGDGATQ